MKKQPQYLEIEIELDGIRHTATYVISSTVVTVHSPYGSNSTQVGGFTAQAVARILFREILNGAKARGEIKA